ncbi:MAG TPA: hypothetical protein VGB55_08440 [Tepidisphaeraceae bacterium]|jgi:hypothetical protein
MPDDLQSLCAQGQDALLATDYLGAEATLIRAESLALAAGDWEALARLYMPLQEARRQRRQRAGEGVVKLDLLATPDQPLDAEALAGRYPHGQLLVGGFGTIEPALRLREIARERRLFLDVFLATAYRVNENVAVAIVPDDHAALPPAGDYAIDQLQRLLPPHSILLPLTELPASEQHGNVTTFAHTMAMWEQLAAPFLAAADAATEPSMKISGYRQTLVVDYASEFAHQRLSHTAREMGRVQRNAPRPAV